MDTNCGGNGGSSEALSALLASHPEVVRRLLAEHIDDGSGRCRLCSSSDTAGRTTFPCRLRSLAESAGALARESNRAAEVEAL